MANELVVVSDTKTPHRPSVVVRDYDEHPKPCRRGYWIGQQENFEQTVTLAANIEGEHPYVGFSVNGQPVVTTGEGPWTDNPFVAPLGHLPCPGLPSVNWSCPVRLSPSVRLRHQISFISEAGKTPYVCFTVQAFFLQHGEELVGTPPHAGPTRKVCLAGFDIDWPKYLILQEQACLKRLAEILRRYSDAAGVGSMNLVEFLGGLPEQDLTLLQAAAQTLEEINADDQPALATALRENVVGILRSRMPRAPGLHPPPSAD